MDDRASTFGRRFLRFGGAAVLGAVLIGLGLLGWRWLASATVDHVAVRGTQHASPDTLRRMARVDSGAVMSELSLPTVADRVERHPWVETAEASPQWIRGTLAIHVTERTPAALVIGSTGRPDFYVDSTGHAMPLPDDAGYDVPLVRGLDTRYHPIDEIAPELLQHVLRALPEAGTTNLVAEIEMRPDSTVQLVTTPVGEHGALPVQLGAQNLSKKLRALRAFAEQVLATQPDAPIAEIDLRFDGQVVTRERSAG